jgi:hypothetical protein
LVEIDPSSVCGALHLPEASHLISEQPRLESVVRIDVPNFTHLPSGNLSVPSPLPLAHGHDCKMLRRGELDDIRVDEYLNHSRQRPTKRIQMKLDARSFFPGPAIVLIICTAFGGQALAEAPRWEMDLNLPLAAFLVEKDMSSCQQMKWHTAEGFTTRFVVRCSADGKRWEQYEVTPALKEISAPVKNARDPYPKSVAIHSWNDMKQAHKVEASKGWSRYQPSASGSTANSSDLDAADHFLAGLPASCSGSYRTVGSDSEVNIKTRCDGNGQKMDGLVTIRNGVITKVE